MIKEIKGELFYICDFCKKITMDYFVISNLWQPTAAWEHFHISCLEIIIGKELQITDLTIHPTNFEFLTSYSIWMPWCKYRKNGKCCIDSKKCNGYCHFKTESKNKLEGILLIQNLRRLWKCSKEKKKKIRNYRVKYSEK